MAVNVTWLAALVSGVALFLVPAAGHSQTAQATTSDEDRRRIEQRLDELKAERDELARTIRDFDSRIDQLETEFRGPQSAPVKPAVDTKTAPSASPANPISVAVTPPQIQPAATTKEEPPQADAKQDSGIPSNYQPGKGYILSSGRGGEIGLSLISYVRYLNQLGLAKTYTDSFGRTKDLQLRQDVQLNKVNITFKGWLFDPDFTFRAWVWTQNTGMGEGAQVVVGGQLGYHFSDFFNLYGGIAPLPSDRTTNWTYPFWLKMDNRTIADEFFRASYTSGFWADGKITNDVLYRAMISNNLSALGVSAAQLDNQFNTMAATVWWMPTTGEYGAGEGFGDYDYHEKVATRFGVHYTRSREDSQAQPSTSDFENSQIRLSDGTLVFQPGAFGTDGQIRKATYQMTAVNAGFKYMGWSLEGEYYARWVNDFQTIGFIPVTHLFDTGFQLEGSTMIIPGLLQAYVAGSEVFGQYGHPWDTTVGINVYPFLRREVHINLEGIYLYRSPVGGNSYPYIVGGNGWLFNTDFILTF